MENPGPVRIPVPAPGSPAPSLHLMDGATEPCGEVLSPLVLACSGHLPTPPAPAAFVFEDAGSRGISSLSAGITRG